MKNTKPKLSFTLCRYNVKHNLHFVVLGAVLLSGCVKETSPATEINEGIQQSVAELTDYAKNNMVMDTDKQLLLQGAKDCAARADALTKTCNVSIEKCQAEKSKLKLERNGLAGIVLLLIGFIIYRPARKLFGL